MTAAAATLERSAGRDVPVLASDAVAGATPASAAASHRLDALKHERHELRRQISRLQETRAELEAPGLLLAEIQAERRLLDNDHGARLSAWVASGCSGQQPELDQTRIDDLTTRLGAAQAASRAAAGPLGVIDGQLGAMRARLAALNDKIALEATSVLAAGVDRELLALQRAVDRVNDVMARLMGFRTFLAREGASNIEFLRIAEAISGRFAMPEIGSTRAQIEAAAAEWARRFEELANG